MRVAVQAIIPVICVCVPSLAREVLTPEEQAERELEAKRQAAPVLAVEPAGFRMEIKEDETRTVRLKVRNAGGGKLMWSVSSAPRWIIFDVRGGDLGFDEERSPASVPVSVTIHRKPRPPEAPAKREPPPPPPPVLPQARWTVAGADTSILS